MSSEFLSDSITKLTISISSFADTLPPPYYAVIFSSPRTATDLGYARTADQMVALATEPLGFLGIESARGADGFGITVS